MSDKDPWLQKVPPQNIEVEKSILSAILIENNTLPEVLEILSEKERSSRLWWICSSEMNPLI